MIVSKCITHDSFHGDGTFPRKAYPSLSLLPVDPRKFAISFRKLTYDPRCAGEVGDRGESRSAGSERLSAEKKKNCLI